MDYSCEAISVQRLILTWSDERCLMPESSHDTTDKDDSRSKPKAAWVGNPKYIGLNELNIDPPKNQNKKI